MSEKTYVVTGCSAGIGLETSRRLIAAGHKVIGVDRHAPEAVELAEFVEADLGDEASIGVAVSKIAAAGPINGLANVAGVSGLGGADLTLRVNFLGLRALTQGLESAFAPGASVVVCASVAGGGWYERKEQHFALARTDSFQSGLQWLAEHPVENGFSYPYSKEAVRVWARVQAAEWLAKGIRVNAVNPGPVSTGLRKEFIESLGAVRVEDDITRVGRDGTVEDIAPLITWLLGDESIWVNGTDIPLDGGLAATFDGAIL
ncbi:coniferyl-alcohol dehydrogenase [Gordonia sp. MP11Mi]|uniref:Coniferyl-alcohol dehydrogenase n=1 Tax=Gordonia sp. MP11Mi TaxID=3022769 RepID=A0AA97GWI1_9ACTN